MDSAFHNHGKRSALVIGRGLHAPWNEGARVIGRDLARALALDHSVRVVSLTEQQFLGQPDPLLHAKHTVTGKGAAGDYRALPRLLALVNVLLNQEPAEVVHLIGVPLVVAPVLRRRGVRVIVHVTMAHHAYQQRLDQLRAALAWRVFDHWIDAYACTSPHVGATLVQQGYKAHKVHVVPPPIDMQRFRPVDRAEARAWLGVDTADIVVGYMGTVSPLRFPAGEIIAALQKVQAVHPAVRLEIIAPLGTHAYNVTWARNHVEQAFVGDSLRARVQVRDLDEAEKALFYNAADLLLLPFGAPVAVEPPLTLLEAMACQTCVVAYPYANRSGIVVQNQNGMTIADSTQLADAVEMYITASATERAHKQHMARATIAQQFSFSAATAAVEALWAVVHANGQPRAATIR